MEVKYQLERDILRSSVPPARCGAPQPPSSECAAAWSDAHRSCSPALQGMSTPWATSH